LQMGHGRGRWDYVHSFNSFWVSCHGHLRRKMPCTKTRLYRRNVAPTVKNQRKTALLAKMLPYCVDALLAGPRIEIVPGIPLACASRDSSSPGQMPDKE
jgi:hypothetical protein